MTNIFDKIREQYKDKEQLFNDMLSSMHIEAEKTQHGFYLLYDCDRNEYLEDGLCDSKTAIVLRLDRLIDEYFIDELNADLHWNCWTYDEILDKVETMQEKEIECYSFDIAVCMLMANRY